MRVTCAVPTCFKVQTTAQVLQVEFSMSRMSDWTEEVSWTAEGLGSHH